MCTQQAIRGSRNGMSVRYSVRNLAVVALRFGS